MGIVVDVIAPVFAIILLAYLIGRYRVLDESSGKIINEFVYYIALPALLFLAVASSPLDRILNLSFIGANLLGILASFVLAVVLGRALFGKEVPVLGIQGMAASYGTTGYMGIPLVVAAFGDAAALPAALATLIHNIPVITIVVLIFELYRGSRGDLRSLTRSVGRAVLINPLFLAVVAGLAVALLGVALPKPIRTFTQLLSNSAGPCALFALGFGLVRHAALETGDERVDRLQVLTLIALKLIFQPLMTFALLRYVFVLEPLWHDVTILMSALPVGVGVYVFAQKYNVYASHVSVAVLTSMIISVASISLLLVVTSGR